MQDAFWWLPVYGPLLATIAVILLALLIFRRRVAKGYVPAKFKEMDDASKLDSPSFEKMESGVKIEDED